MWPLSQSKPPNLLSPKKWMPPLRVQNSSNSKRHCLHTKQCAAVVHSLTCVTQHVTSSATPWTAAHQASLSLTISWSSPKFMSFESVMLSNHLILCHLLLLLPSIFPSIKVCYNESTLHIRWPNYWSFSFSFIISPSSEYSGLISFRIDWFDFLAVQETLKGLLQHHGLTSILWCSAFFMVLFSHLYMTTGTTIAFTIQTFVGKVLSLLFNMLPRSVIDFLLRSKRLLISRLQSYLQWFWSPKRDNLSLLPLFPHLPWRYGTGCYDPSFFNVEL